jgi:hypothetical protein
VEYIDQVTAETAGLVKVNDDFVYMGVDFTTMAPERGRRSVRLTSKSAYNHGLVILDLTHMPGNACGSWPALCARTLPYLPVYIPISPLTV